MVKPYLDEGPSESDTPPTNGKPHEPHSENPIQLDTSFAALRPDLHRELKISEEITCVCDGSADRVAQCLRAALVYSNANQFRGEDKYSLMLDGAYAEINGEFLANQKRKAQCAVEGHNASPGNSEMKLTWL